MSQTFWENQGGAMGGQETAVEVVTFGCRLNTYESEVMKGKAAEAGLSDAVIINTCAVTKEAERQARQSIRKLRKEHPNKTIVVTGCAAQLDPEAYAAMPEVDRVLGNAEKMTAEGYHPSAQALAVSDIMTEAPETGETLEGFEGRTRAFVQVQQGCDHRCTFCVIPLARGPNRSVPLGGIVDQAKRLTEGGYKEITLTGVDILSFGADLPGQPSLAEAISRLLALVPDIKRLRLSSLDPAVIDADLIALFATEPRMVPFAHLSVQAGDDMTLKQMKRRHLRDDVLRVCAALKDARPDIALGADLIAGFPTETEERFLNSLALVEEADLTHLHVFPYSPREGTPAAKLKALPGDVVKARASALREAGQAALARFLAPFGGKTVEVLVEKEGFGHTGHLLPVHFGGEAAKGIDPGALVSIKVEQAERTELRGSVA